jgi:hypothetical protein
VALRINGRPVGPLPFGVWDETMFDEIFEAIRIKRSNKINQPNSTNGGI